MGKGEAMRQAQLDTMQEYPSPFYWAAFTLIGDMGALGALDHAEQVETVEAPEENDTPDVPSRHWLWIGGAVLLVAVGGAWAWRRRTV
jgi:MYXO-CTERM domain-containing protein